jgi:hypothetical protein
VIRPILASALLALAVAACSPSASPTSTTGDCATDVRAPGTFPDLEALLPRGMIEASPTSVDSGVNCTAEALATYRAHGITALRFAGATWDYGKGNATVVAVLTARPVGQPLLEAAWVEEFYQAGAFAAAHTENIGVTHPNVPGAGIVFRLDTLNNLSLQTVVVFPAETYVHVVIVATEVGPDASREDHDQRVQVAIQVAAGV